ncbi:MAG: pyridoxamine 5'-phosphate oxidase family protein, partial [Anaerolineales bacterium]
MTFPKTPRSRIKRVPERGYYDRETIYDILDQGMICHVGIAPEGQPVVIPTLYARVGDEIVFHGAKASRLLKYMQNGGEVCVAVTLVDGLVLARSTFHHSINYRSVVAFGKGRLIDNEVEKMQVLEAISEQLLPGRWADARVPNPKEMKATTVVAVKIEEASAKTRTGPPGDDDEDYALPVWAGVVPIRQVNGQPEADPLLKNGIPVPEYIQQAIP